MYGAPPPPALKKGMATWVIVLLCLAGALPIAGGVFASLAIYGVRKYIATAKTAEARNALGQIGKDVASVYERDHALCPSASSPVPVSMRALRGLKYQSAAADWAVDRAQNAGFACLRFAMSAPQYYQYSYARSGSGQFTATAHGDLNGDGKVSTFILRGAVTGGVLTIAPSLEETDPEE